MGEVEDQQHQARWQSGNKQLAVMSLSRDHLIVLWIWYLPLFNAVYREIGES